MYKVWAFIKDYSLFLISGAVIALFWANISPESYYKFQHFVLIEDFFIGKKHLHEGGHITYDLDMHYLVNDIFMAFFFFIAAKEVWEAVALKSGSMRGRRALTPLFATFGGMAGPIALYLGLALFLGSDVYDAVARGWAIPTATDIAFSYLVGRIIFGAGHPAVRFLLLLAIADDAAGLIILAVFYPTGEVLPAWLLLSFGAAALAYLLFNALPVWLDRGREDRPVSSLFHKKLGFWPFLLAGIISWYGFFLSGLHTALGLLPIVAAIPHAESDFGIFSAAEKYLQDMLNQIEHMLRYPVEVILFFFGLLNAGVGFSSIGPATWLVLAGLIIGKPIGVLAFGWLAAKPLKLGLPEGMEISHIFLVGMIAGIGFTVSLFVAVVAFPEGAVQSAARMGAVLSFVAVPLSFIFARIFKVKKATS